MWNQLGLQDALAPIMEELMYFHDFAMTILIFIMIYITWIMGNILTNKVINKSLLSGQLLEFVWTMFPIVILIQIALPSLILLYLMENPCSSYIDVKIVGHQWYWSYEFANNVEFDSIMVPTDMMEENMFRLLDVDNRLTLPYNCPIRVMISSADVLHSWTVPSLGVKADATPGRLNQASFVAYRPGVVFGQCSEICGANHSFMPIALEFISPEDWVKYLISNE